MRFLTFPTSRDVIEQNWVYMFIVDRKLLGNCTEEFMVKGEFHVLIDPLLLPFHHANGENVRKIQFH